MTLLFAVFAAFLLTTVTWVFYVAAIHLIPKLKAMPTVVRYLFGYPAVALAYVLDVAINVVATFVFVSSRFPYIDLPQGRHWWLLTGRLKRLKIGPQGWAKNAATWVCANLLNPFDPSGEHC